jgi:uncharacterized protein
MNPLNVDDEFQFKYLSPENHTDHHKKEEEIRAQLTKLESEIQQLENTLANAESSELLIDRINEYNAKSPRIRWIVVLTLVLVVLSFLISYNIYLSKPEFVRLTILFLEEVFNWGLINFILVGLAAQMVDGALGMAYGATCTSFLLGLGLPPATASASVHVAEIFTTGVSGLSHLKFGNVNKKLFLYLLVPGIVGAVLGAYLLSDVINGDLIKPFIAVYLLVLGIVILRKALLKKHFKKKTKNVGWLAGFGGFMDAVGGGGWGPIVTSTLLSTGRSANYTIGSVNLAEFFIALSGAGTFLVFTGISGWQAIIGLIIGGVFASPFAAFVVSKVKRKPLMIFVGILIMCLSLRTFFTSDYGKLFSALITLFDEHAS